MDLSWYSYDTLLTKKPDDIAEVLAQRVRMRRKQKLTRLS